MIDEQAKGEALQFSPVKVAVISLFPEMFRALTESGVTRRAVERGLIELVFIDPRQFADDKHQTVDDRPYGGGPGMVMRVEPLVRALDCAFERLSCDRQAAKVIYMSPQGRLLDARGVDSLGNTSPMVLICGRYEGIDERFIETFVDEEWSIGDYVLSGGELPAMVMLDALIRKIPGALGGEQSAEQDSFESGLLDCPHYTRPETVLGQTVPSVLLSGDHEKIRRWRLQQALERTFVRRPELLEKLEFDDEQAELLKKYCADCAQKDKH